MPAKAQGPISREGWIGVGVFAVFLVVALSVYAHHIYNPGPAPKTVEAQTSAWEDGCTKGFLAGSSLPTQTRRAPTPVELDALASNAFEHSAGHVGDREQWTHGFRAGYEEAYNRAGRPAF